MLRGVVWRWEWRLFLHRVRGRLDERCGGFRLRCVQRRVLRNAARATVVLRLPRRILRSVDGGGVLDGGLRRPVQCRLSQRNRRFGMLPLPVRDIHWFYGAGRLRELRGWFHECGGNGKRVREVRVWVLCCFVGTDLVHGVRRGHVRGCGGSSRLDERLCEFVQRRVFERRRRDRVHGVCRRLLCGIFGSSVVHFVPFGPLRHCDGGHELGRRMSDDVRRRLLRGWRRHGVRCLRRWFLLTYVGPKRVQCVQRRALRCVDRFDVVASRLSGCV